MSPNPAGAATVKALPPGVVEVLVQACSLLAGLRGLLNQDVHFDGLLAAHVVLHDSCPEAALLPRQLDSNLLRMSQAAHDVAVQGRPDSEQRDQVPNDGADERSYITGLHVQILKTSAVDVQAVRVHERKRVANLEAQSEHARACLKVEDQKDAAEYEEVDDAKVPGHVIGLLDAVGEVAVHEHDVKRWQQHAVEVVPTSRHGAAQVGVHGQSHDKCRPLHAEAVVVEEMQLGAEVSQRQACTNGCLAEGDFSEPSVIDAHASKGDSLHEASREGRLLCRQLEWHVLESPFCCGRSHERARHHREKPCKDDQ
mmetsp:Transcript_17511/g.28011  ORF Transcript_17511/g.28011 Transcript_17511/m.28011 type:complete len:312 (+) Transcript_17511:442-1377(+)